MPDSRMARGKSARHPRLTQGGEDNLITKGGKHDDRPAETLHHDVPPQGLARKHVLILAAASEAMVNEAA